MHMPQVHTSLKKGKGCCEEVMGVKYRRLFCAQTTKPKSEIIEPKTKGAIKKNQLIFFSPLNVGCQNEASMGGFFFSLSFALSTYRKRKICGA